MAARHAILRSAVAGLVGGLLGCGSDPRPATTRPVTAVDAKQATPDYWWTRPGVTAVRGPGFRPLWDACRAELHGRFFAVDREDYRDGLMTTEPMVSKQVFEPWRTDAVTYDDVIESSLATVRRTVRFEVSARPDGSFVAVPKVLVERYASAERRLTAITQYHQAFSGPRAFADQADESGDATVKDAVADYWYALRRDADLERDLAASIARRLGPATRRSPE